MNLLVEKDYLNKIIQSDALDLVKQLPDNCVDMIITSPPYNYDMPYDIYEDVLSFDKYWEYLRSVFDESKRVLKPNGRVAINIQADFWKHIPLHHHMRETMCGLCYDWWCEIIWNKGRYNTRHSQFGSWLLPSAPCIKISWEYIELFHLGDRNREIRREDADITKEEFITYTNAMWNIPPENQSKKYGHPAMFPKELPYRLIKLLTYKNDVILDMFCGAGTTCYVAKKLGRNYIGSDISKQYCEITRERCQD